jgi:hypothetical protein
MYTRSTGDLRVRRGTSCSRPTPRRALGRVFRHAPWYSRLQGREAATNVPQDIFTAPNRAKRERGGSGPQIARKPILRRRGSALLRDAGPVNRDELLRFQVPIADGRHESLIIREVSMFKNDDLEIFLGFDFTEQHVEVLP